MYCTQVPLKEASLSIYREFRSFIGLFMYDIDLYGTIQGMRNRVVKMEYVSDHFLMPNQFALQNTNKYCCFLLLMIALLTLSISIIKIESKSMKRLFFQQVQYLQVVAIG
jgi:hypothetical protein